MGSGQEIYRVHLPHVTPFQSECQQASIRLVRAIDPKHWAHAYFPGKRYEFFVSNMAEI